jgi:hypothetical protein
MDKNDEEEITQEILDGDETTSTNNNCISQSNVAERATRNMTKERDNNEREKQQTPISPKSKDTGKDDDASCASSSSGASSLATSSSAYSSSSSVSSASSLASCSRSSSSSCSSDSSESSCDNDNDDDDSQHSTPPTSPPSVIRRQRRRASSNNRHDHDSRRMEKDEEESSSFACYVMCVLTVFISVMVFLLARQIFIQQQHEYEKGSLTSHHDHRGGHGHESVSKTQATIKRNNLLDSKRKSTLSGSNTDADPDTMSTTTPTAEEWSGFVGEVITVNPPANGSGSSSSSSSDDEALLARSKIVTKKIFKAFQRDGVVAVRGLLDNEDLMQHLEQVSMDMVQTQTRKRAGKKGTQFHTVKHGMLFMDTPPTSTITTTKDSSEASSSSPPKHDNPNPKQQCANPQDATADEKRVCETASTVSTTKSSPSASPPFRQVALSSNVAKFASELLLQMKAQEPKKHPQSSTPMRQQASKDTTDTVRVVRYVHATTTYCDGGCSSRVAKYTVLYYIFSMDALVFYLQYAISR